jgi:hypothetical protein
MTAARKPAPPDADMAALLDLLGRARRALAHEDEVELGRLLPLLAELESAPGAASDRDPPAARRALLSLLDEAGQLAAQLRREQARLAAELRATGVHRRAGFAYRRAAKL